MKKSSANLLCVLLLSTPAFAESPDVILPEIVATASRWGEPVERVPQNMTIITRADIEKKGATFVTDLLRLQSDLQVVQNGGTGSNATLLMRGGGSNQVLVMVDGIKFNSPSTGSADLSSLLTTDIERIEIIKGPQSTLYGSEAMAGVVNIITKKGAGKLKADLSVEGGSFATVKTAGSVSGGTDKTNYRLSATWFDTDGIPTAKNGLVRNGDTNKSVSGRFGVDPTDTSSIELNVRYGTDKTHLDNYSYGVGPVDTLNYVQNHENYLVAATGKIFPWEKYEQSLTLSYLRDNLNTTDPVTAYNNYRINATTKLLDWQHTLDLRPFTLTGGFAYRNEAADSEGTFDQSIDNKAGYLNAKLGLLEDTLVLTAGLRYDDHSTFGDAVTYRTGVLYYLKPLEMRFKANLGSGFRAPSLNELYYPNYGNTNLKPEKSTGYDIGVEKDLFDKKLVIGATWFWQRYRNLIQTDSSTYSAVNIGNAQTEGVEIKATALPTENLKLNAGYTYLEAIDKATGAFLSLRPRDKVTTSIEYTLAKLTVIAEYQYVAKRFDSSLNQDISPYALVNLKGSYVVCKNFSIFARIDNLLDKSYEEAAGYGTPGISAFGGVKVTY
ncbi:MAG: TonB-dependent receptor [Proteobacteria bacterium]|nr:TonB-dependent receptor [Pseudomonadota bacterium]